MQRGAVARWQLRPTPNAAVLAPSHVKSCMYRMIVTCHRARLTSSASVLAAVESTPLTLPPGRRGSTGQAGTVGRHSCSLAIQCVSQPSIGAGRS